MRIALATAPAYPELSPDDRLLLGALERHGAAASPAVWSDPLVDWRAFDAVVIRSCWDYHLRFAEFAEWLGRVESSGVAVWNPPAVLRWNSSKTYLRELRDAGVPTLPTRWVERGETASLRSILDEAGWERAVVKPAVSASAHGTWLTSRARATDDEDRFRVALAEGGLLVQRFEETITTEGEWSLIFLDGEFSHAVRKRPRDGDFRVQEEHGGTFEAGVAPDEALRGATAALAASESVGRTLYARVDGCVVDGAFVLMELEAIEPLLFLGSRCGAADALARGLLRRVDLS